MDYKYIEQLLERYWEGETSVEEESILRTFFCAGDVPAQLQRYVPIFQMQQHAAQERLSDDFDQRMMALVEKDTKQKVQPETKAKVISLRSRLVPLFNAAASIAVFVTVGLAVEQATRNVNSNNADSKSTASAIYMSEEQVADITNKALQVQENTFTAQTVTTGDSLILPTLPVEVPVEE
jgi:hypothetical protein